ncbi:cation-transporting P-type ATPase [Halomonas ramblicola]|uniref:cation-transporting P-type ATPase n=1 Tax=Halomonas ramblicola TaxID=747349 RepID=UPI0025B5AE44|nr:cation-transporting P-type ATPase [Halomonas ramblicola]MDN3520163.1 cation-transporting P-type ATPase [Halomonas ramblicola]
MGTEPPAWHSLSAEQALASVQTDKHGLHAEEAQARLQQYGRNELPPARQRGPLRRFLSQFNNLLIYVLLVAAAITLAIGHVTDAVVIVAVALLNAGIGFLQEGKAEKALGAIRQMLSSQASVLRDGARTTVPAAELVPGDIVLIESGDRVPADLRLLKCKGLQIQEAALTGESVAVTKDGAAVDAAAELGDRRGMAYSGTMVTFGQGVGVVMATGAATEIGKISRMLAETETLQTPLLRQMDSLARRLTAIILVVAAAVYAVAVYGRDYAFTEAFMAVVSLAVAAIPEGLPAILTITLAIGVQRMAARRAIIRRLPAVETLGSVSVICSDKTGTLTRNEMTVRGLVTAAAHYQTTGVGYAPHGDVRLDGVAVESERHPVLVALIRAGMLCNDAALRQDEGGDWRVDGDPMEGALITAARKIGLEEAFERKARPRSDEIPFDAAHRFMASLHHDHEGHGEIYLKGAPERVLSMCDQGEVALDADYWHRRVAELAAEGQRVIAVAARPAEAEQSTLSFEHVGDGMVLLGLVGLIDPPREEAVQAVAECHEAGIQVKMITGDHAGTARAIAAQLGLANTERAVTGAEIEQADDETLRQWVDEVDVFARASPEHKLRLVQALQANGRVIAMTGDGVNDAPALKRADVGIAMGHKGTEAAKEAAEMVLADDNFASIVNAVREGRTVYDNLKKAVTFLLPINGGESMAVIAAILLGLVLPITPLQILWVNMVSSIALALALAFEPTEPNVMRRPPRPADEPMLTGFLLWRVTLVSGLFLAGIFGMFQWALAAGASLENARTVAVNTLVVMEVFYLFSVRYIHGGSLTWQGVIGTPAVLYAVGAVSVLQLLFTYTPLMATFFATRPVTPQQGVLIVLVGMALFAVLEVEKALRQRLGFTRPSER